jgi:hypothetical protein
MHRIPVGLVAALLLAGCGSRSTVLSPRAGASDGSLADHAVGLADRVLRLDQPSCVPAPSSDVLGKYQASWNGVWRCPGQSGINIGGDILFEMKSGENGTYAMKGTMFGIAPSPVFSGSLTGGMACTTLTATVPTIALGSGIQATGSLSAEFAYVSPYVGWGFPEGVWNATQMGGSCSASGTWIASRY